MFQWQVTPKQYIYIYMTNSYGCRRIRSVAYSQAIYIPTYGRSRHNQYDVLDVYNHLTWGSTRLEQNGFVSRHLWFMYSFGHTIMEIFKIFFIRISCFQSCQAVTCPYAICNHTVWYDTLLNTLCFRMLFRKALTHFFRFASLILLTIS